MKTGTPGSASRPPWDQHPSPVGPLDQLSEEPACQHDNRQRDVDEEPGHLLAGDGVSEEGHHRPVDQEHAKGVAPANVEDGCQEAEDEWQELVHRGDDEVVVPGLVPPGHVLLYHPVPQGLPDAGADPHWVGEEGRVHQDPYDPEDGGASPPYGPAPLCSPVDRKPDEARDDQEGHNDAAPCGRPDMGASNRLSEHEVGPAQQGRVLEVADQGGPLGQGEGNQKHQEGAVTLRSLEDGPPEAGHQTSDGRSDRSGRR